MSLPVIIQQRAEEDIVRNALWWADNHSIDEAIEWEAVVRRQVMNIGSQPYSHGFSAENSRFPLEIRDALVGKGRPLGSYRAVFTVKDDHVYVLRLMRAAEDRLLLRDIRNYDNLQ